MPRRFLPRSLPPPAAVGCLVFVIYGGSLFYRMKSKELGVLMALGTPKKTLADRLLKEISVLCLISGAAGSVAGIGVACVISRMP